jgi:hypothetical protein
MLNNMGDVMWETGKRQGGRGVTRPEVPRSAIVTNWAINDHPQAQHYWWTPQRYGGYDESFACFLHGWHNSFWYLALSEEL